MSRISFRFYCALFFGRGIQTVLRFIGRSAGGTWPGEIALFICPDFISRLKRESFRIVFIAGTNGKTTTGKMIQTILSEHSFSVRVNESGANLVNGLVSVLLSHPIISKKPVTYVLEVDEASLPHALRAISPDVLVLLNIFRDQLDRYGEIRSVVAVWKKSIETLSPKATIIANADDPSVAYVSSFHTGKVRYFGLEDSFLFQKKTEHATDSLYCPKCMRRLTYQGVYFSHLGIWTCGNCAYMHPDVTIKASDVVSPLPGTYNIYNTLAATDVAQIFGVSRQGSKNALSHFSPAFGRMESISYKGRTVTILLSKNPTGFNQSLKVTLDNNPGSILFVLNDRIPDGTDVSWIYDVDFEQIATRKRVRCVIGGDRVFDMALRLQYAGIPADQIFPFESLRDAIQNVILQSKVDEKLWVLATYSGMLEVRKILTGKKI